ncbi:MAG: hypothetical protein ACXVEE_24730 [Polyangiales bacterium]
MASTRRGAIAIGAAKAWFLVAGLAQNVLLPMAIGQASFGAYKRALAFVNVVNNLIVVASIQAASRAVSSTAGKRTAMRRTVAIHAAIGLGLGVLFTALVPLIVAHQHAPQLARPLHAMAAILLLYGAYAPLVGALNGVQAFGAQAGLDALYSTLRTAGLVLGGWWLAKGGGDGAFGASLGFVVAAATILPIAILATRRIEDEGPATFDRRDHLAFLVGLLAMQGFQSLLLQIDLIVLGRAATIMAAEQGIGELAARVLADRVSGLYSQAQAFGLVPYQLLLAAGFVMFPAIAAAKARGDEQEVKQQVLRGGAAALVVAGALAAAIGATPMAVLRFAFGHGVTNDPHALPLELAAPILRVLAIAHAATAIAALGTTIVAAAGKGRIAALLAATVAVLAMVGAGAGGDLAPDTARLGVYVASGLAAGIIAGAIIVAIAVAQMIGTFVRVASLLRVLVALAAALIAGAYLPVPDHRLLAMVWPAAPLAVYLAVVAVLGEPLRRYARL